MPHEIRSPRGSKLVIQKHVALSAFFSAVLLLHCVFMSNPHRPSPLADPHAQIRCAKAATGCIHSASNCLQHVPRSHYLVFHGQCAFVSTIVLLQFVRESKDSAYNEAASSDIQNALKILQSLEEAWKGARKCRAIAEEYLEFTYHVLQSGRSGICNFEHGHEKSHNRLLTIPPPKGPHHSRSKRTPKKRKRSYYDHFAFISCCPPKFDELGPHPHQKYSDELHAN